MTGKTERTAPVVHNQAILALFEIRIVAGATSYLTIKKVDSFINFIDGAQICFVTCFHSSLLIINADGMLLAKCWTNPGANCFVISSLRLNSSRKCCAMTGMSSLRCRNGGSFDGSNRAYYRRA